MNALAAALREVVGPDHVIDDPDITTKTDQKRRQIGLYVQDQIALDNWRLILSARHDWAKGKTENKLTDTAARQSDSAFTGRAGIAYVSEIGLVPYFSYATSFEPVAGTNLQSFRTTVQAQHAWFAAAASGSTTLTPGNAPPASINTLGAFDSPRGCRGTFGSVGTAQATRIEADFTGTDCQSATFTGRVVLTKQ
jgi:outer membrane receptor protein involved in Fe transport